MFEVKAYGYNKDDLTKRVPLKIYNEEKYYEYLKIIAEEYPFLTVVGLRIITEIKLKDFLQNQGITFNDKDTLSVLVNKLPNSIPKAQIEILRDFAEFENIASHGYEIAKETGKWALGAIPAFLKGIK
jgi:hypothetical protein